MFLGIEPEVWLQLWDGVIGSFLAAIIGGLVALAVVRLTTKHQSRLAAESREKAAIAEFAAAAGQLLNKYSRGIPKVESLRQLLDTASFRWRMEAHEDLDEIGAWPAHLSSLAIKALEAGDSSQGNSPEYAKLRKSVVLVRLLALEWADSDQKARDKWMERLEKERLGGLAGLGLE